MTIWRDGMELMHLIGAHAPHGEYRQYWQWLVGVSESAETDAIMGQVGPLAPVQEIMKCKPKESSLALANGECGREGLLLFHP